MDAARAFEVALDHYRKGNDCLHYPVAVQMEEQALHQTERAREMLLMGMRLVEGLDPVRFAARTGVALEAALDPSVLRQALDEGYLLWRDGCLVATPAGRLRLDALLTAVVL